MEQNKNSNNQSGQFVTVYKIASAAMIIFLLIIGAMVFPLSFEVDGRYMISSPAVIALYVAIGLAVVFALSSFLFFKGLTVSAPCTTTKRVTALLSAVASAVPFIYYIYSDVSAKIGVLFAEPGTLTAPYSGLDTLSTLITVVSAISLICSLYLVIRQSKIAALIAGYSRVIFLALIITKLYLDFSVELNSPVKILVQFAAVAAMMATTANIKPIVRKQKAAAFLSVEFLSATLCLLCFALFALEIAPHSAKYTADLVAFPIMLLAFGIESAVLLFTCRTSSHDEPIEISAVENETAVSEDSDASSDAEEPSQLTESKEAADTAETTDQ